MPSAPAATFGGGALGGLGGLGGLESLLGGAAAAPEPAA